MINCFNNKTPWRVLLHAIFIQLLRMGYLNMHSNENYPNADMLPLREALDPSHICPSISMRMCELYPADMPWQNQ